jgi:hypothetical protein
MIDPSENASDSPTLSGDKKLPPDDLPRVEPPSAGFIVQLFLVPGLIVLAIVAVWALFGQLTSSEQDWRRLTTELRSPNEHRRGRAAMGLAQLLKADQERGGSGQQLAVNRELARELVGLLEDRLGPSGSAAHLADQQVFLAGTLGFLDLPEIVLPVLQQAAQPECDIDVRKGAIRSMIQIAGRAHDRGDALNLPALADGLIAASNDADAALSHLATYALGLIETESARAHLTVLLEDTDQKTRFNAAIGLARQGSTGGFAVFQAVLADAGQHLSGRLGDLPESVDARRAAVEEQFNQNRMIENTLDAIERLAPQFDASQRAELTALISPIAEGYFDNKIQIEATETQLALQASH